MGDRCIQYPRFSKGYILVAKECFGFLLNQIGDAEEVFDMEDDQLDDINTNQEAQEDQVTRKEI